MFPVTGSIRNCFGSDRNAVISSAEENSTDPGTSQGGNLRRKVTGNFKGGLGLAAPARMARNILTDLKTSGADKQPTPAGGCSGPFATIASRIVLAIDFRCRIAKSIYDDSETLEEFSLMPVMTGCVITGYILTEFRPSPLPHVSHLQTPSSLPL